MVGINDIFGEGAKLPSPFLASPLIRGKGRQGRLWWAHGMVRMVRSHVASTAGWLDHNTAEVRLWSCALIGLDLSSLQSVVSIISCLLNTVLHKMPSLCTILMTW